MNNWRRKIGLAAALAIGLVFVPASAFAGGDGGGGKAAVPAAPVSLQALQSCQTEFHARPTSTGWFSDPCATQDYPNDGFVSAAVRVQHFWSMSGGAHITDIRGTLTICNGEPATIARVSADAVALHKRSDFAEYASSNQPQQVSSNCATMLTVSKAVRGCGAADHPLGPNAYASYTEARGGSRTVDGTLAREPNAGYYTTPSSYYLTVISGAAC